jgi:opacity protein-like surface antigen
MRQRFLQPARFNTVLMATEYANRQTIRPACYSVTVTFFTDHQGVEVNYGFSRFNQQYTSLNPAVPLSLGVPANTNEATASYVYRRGIGHRLSPFVSVGTGALVFLPDSFISGTTAGSTFATPDFVYSAGADFTLSRRVSLRLGYRGHVFEAPDFGVPGINTGSVTHMAQPFGGLSLHF